MIRVRKPVYSPQEIKEMARDFNIGNIMKTRAYQNRPLDFETAYLLGVYALTPYKKELGNLFNETKESAAIGGLTAICALNNRATYSHQEKRSRRYSAAEQIAGICGAVMDYDIGLSSKGFLNPKVSYAIDNCGMGGDVRVTPNVSTVSALIAAAAGIPMCKHGSPANADKGKHGSSDFFAQMVLEMKNHECFFPISKEKTEKCIEKFNFGYTEALDEGYKVIHKQTHEYARLPHMNDIIGPVTNPLGLDVATKKIIGINHLIPPLAVAQAYQILNEKGVTNIKDGLFLRGFVFEDRQGPENDDGMDELSTMPGGTLIARLTEGKIEEYNLYAEDFGLCVAKYEDIRPTCDESGKYKKGEFSLRILKNEEKGPARDMVLANAALIEHLASGTNLKEAYKKMRDVLESGTPYRNAMQIKEFLRS